MQNYQLVLASTSPFRQQLLSKLHLPFSTAAPDCDETPHVGESPQRLVQRLAEEKARSCSVTAPSLVIGSDQVCVINGQIVGKPHTRAKAIEQLLSQSGQAITFYTGLALYNTETDQAQVVLDTFTVHFRQLSREMATHYVDREQPLNCAGSFKSEGLGIALFERLEGDDPNTLVGLPLIQLVKLLENESVYVL
ncbi:septum formation inhibitor Maf [Vibrio fluvialis]|uniref:Maf family protein n=1 Tax=Vibrio fluvialis TaxID=676 RepID=UPI000C21E9CC|nr:nucleoside triphosphate pyrophosphatase [Vibrio fluvialis]EKO3963115.1 septum formation inhibitor Maf [Vibrio fluvialis]MBY7823334.1 Maf-like protein [Vibrio fluvialis]MBY7852625.1 Maf-like protein [Vibrio fluvialis]MBY7884830.1 Maf-like protein [Vibrio fluvialis]MBY7927642.1 Maf-like protein [Vibrio fluvialis]